MNSVNMKISGTLALASMCLTVFAACGDGGSSDPIGDRIQQIFPSDPSFGAIDRAQVRRMMEVPPEADGPFFMLDLVHHRDRAEYEDGRETNLSGAEADALYGSLILPILTDIGARPVFVANVEMNLIDPDGSDWHQVGIVRYPSRAAFFEMLERDDFIAAAAHEQAGVEKTLVMVAHELREAFPDSFYEVDLQSLPTPPTPEDQPIAILHILDYHDTAQYADGRETSLTGREAMALYEQGRADQGTLALGVRPGLYLDIEGELVGDGRQFNEFRINNFPNRRTFFGVASTFDEAGGEHREAALRETYTQLSAPIIHESGYR